MFLHDEKVTSDDEGPEPEARWKLVFDGASNVMGYGIGVILISPKNGYTPLTSRPCFNCTNNIAKYEACIMDIDTVIDLRIKILEVYEDSALVIYQVKGEWETRHHKLISYLDQVVELMVNFKEITFHHIPREENQMAYALATSSSTYKVKFHNEAPIIRIGYKYEPICCATVEEGHDNKLWFYDIKCYLQKQEYPTNASSGDKKTLRILESNFFLNGDVVYKTNHDMVLLKCMDRHETNMLI
ncbi:uncharacterized protein LOC127096117 [Lathyrus oleraceus]|uniref:uncharacterized protein LOC127096117 n=1 Tax=Pisum sativum TaxID=3888 RepID=UPI0021D27B14|nr:uncharacterized protein LOC127096117 [Pisum sativum]